MCYKRFKFSFLAASSNFETLGPSSGVWFWTAGVFNWVRPPVLSTIFIFPLIARSPLFQAQILNKPDQPFKIDIFQRNLEPSALLAVFALRLISRVQETISHSLSPSVNLLSVPLRSRRRVRERTLILLSAGSSFHEQCTEFVSWPRWTRAWTRAWRPHAI